MIGQRKIFTVLEAIFQARHYQALYASIRHYPNWLENLKRYVLGTGEYPYGICIRTPLGMIEPTIYGYHDMLTVNEIFCREDYPVGRSHQVIVDIGANIGISALYFLTRHTSCKCYLFEPVPINVERLRRNLQPFAERYVLEEKAVADRSGSFSFGIEPTGRYGGLHRSTGDNINVSCVHINDVINDILKKEGRIDILKIDIEGDEISTVAAIADHLLKQIEIIYFEFDGSLPQDAVDLIPVKYHSLKKRGTVCTMTKK